MVYNCQNGQKSESLERLKIRFEMVKFKITLFTTILGASIFVLLNKSRLSESVDIVYVYFTAMVLFAYGVFGYVVNMVELNELKRMVDE